MSMLTPPDDVKATALRLARAIFSERHPHPMPWKHVHLTFAELCSIIEDVIKTTLKDRS